jgi:hypothetical protein
VLDDRAMGGRRGARARDVRLGHGHRAVPRIMARVNEIAADVSRKATLTAAEAGGACGAGGRVVGADVREAGWAEPKRRAAHIMPAHSTDGIRSATNQAVAVGLFPDDSFTGAVAGALGRTSSGHRAGRRGGRP